MMIYEKKLHEIKSKCLKKFGSQINYHYIIYPLQKCFVNYRLQLRNA